MRKNEDPRLSFSTPEFKEAQRIFTDGFKVTGGHCFCRLRCPAACTPLTRSPLLQKNFGKPVEWALVKDHAWSTPQLRKLDNPVGV